MRVSNHHNAFERHHRFIGWLGIAVGTNQPKKGEDVLTAPDNVELCHSRQLLRHQEWRVPRRRRCAAQRPGVLVCHLHHRLCAHPVVHPPRGAGRGRDCETLPFVNDNSGPALTHRSPLPRWPSSSSSAACSRASSAESAGRPSWSTTPLASSARAASPSATT